MKHGTMTGYTYHKCRCGECKAAKAVDQKRYRSSPSGSQKRREELARRRRAFRDEISAIKLAAQCVDCTEVFYDPGQLEFDHRDPDTKLFKVSAGVRNYGRATVLAEIEKCDVVCNACHVERTKARGQYVEAGRKGGKVTHAS